MAIYAFTINATLAQILWLYAFTMNATLAQILWLYAFTMNATPAQNIATLLQYASKLHPCTQRL